MEHPADRSAALPGDDRAASLGIAGIARSASSRSVQEHLERLLLNDQELLISLHCQLEQIRRELRLLNDERIVRALAGEEDSSIRH